MFIAFLKLSALHLLGLISPGPDFVMVVRNSLLYEKRVALSTVLGIALGIGVHVTYALLGLSLIALVPWLLSIVKYIGAAYLIYLGVMSFVVKDKPATKKEGVSNKQNISLQTAMKQGFLCNVLNPKAALFIVGLFTLVVAPETGIGTKLFYGLWMMFVTAAWFSFVVMFIHKSRFRARLLNSQHTVNKWMGALLIICGLQLIVYDVFEKIIVL